MKKLKNVITQGVSYKYLILQLQNNYEHFKLKCNFKNSLAKFLPIVITVILFEMNDVTFLYERINFILLVFKNSQLTRMDKEKDFKYFKMYKYFDLIFCPKLYFKNIKFYKNQYS